MKNADSVTKAVLILKHISNGVNRISDLAQELCMGKSTVHRLLKSMESSSLVIQNPFTRHYYLGPLILEFSSRPIIAHQNLVVCAWEEMRRLRNLTGETVGLYIRSGLDRVCLEEVESPSAIKHAVGKGSSVNLHVGSSGKILLAELQDQELQLILKNMSLIRMGPNTITRKDALLEELKKVRKQGYATSFGEKTPGGASLSVPVKNYICPVALTILAPESRLSSDRMMLHLSEMIKSGKQISDNLTQSNL